MISEEKSLLRTEALRNLSRIERHAEDAQRAADLFFTSIQPARGQVIAAYWPFASEFDMHPLIETALGLQHILALPAVKYDGLILDFILWDGRGDLQKGPKGALQPAGGAAVLPDIVIVPLLAFDRQGYRLGRGGGYYDATLEYLRNQKSITAVGMAYAQQACLFNLPVEAHDQKLNWIITPQEAKFFGDI